MVEFYFGTGLSAVKWTNKTLDLFDLELQITTVVSGTVSYPWDTVLRRMMVDSGRPKHLKQFHNSMHAIHLIYKQGGIPAFYKVYAI